MLPLELQSLVVERVAKSGAISQAAIATIDTLLTQRISATFGTAALVLGGPRDAANLINLAAGEMRNTVLPAIASSPAQAAVLISCWPLAPSEPSPQSTEPQPPATS